jgi:hypothetical protein
MLAYTYMHHMGSGWGVLMMVGWVAVLALIIFGVSRLWRGHRS